MGWMYRIFIVFTKYTEEVHDKFQLLDLEEQKIRDVIITLKNNKAQGLEDMRSHLKKQVDEVLN